MLSSNVKHFVFECPETSDFNFIPGQFITLHIQHDDKILRRSYSIANTPSHNNRIEFAAGYVENGPATALLFNLKPGATLSASGPVGRLILKEDYFPRIILVATSTGVTPFRAMKEELLLRMQKHPELKIVLLQGVQYRDDILYKDELVALAESHPQFSFYACLSREDKTSLTAHEFSGYVQTKLPELNLQPLSDLVYLCGNPAMIDEAFQLLKDQGFPSQQVIREKYISS